MSLDRAMALAQADDWKRQVDERAGLPVARAFVEPKAILRRLIADTAAGKTIDWQADGAGDFHVVEA